MKPMVPAVSVNKMAEPVTIRRGFKCPIKRSCPPHQQDGHVVVQLGGAGPLAHRFHDSANDELVLAIGMPGDQLDQALLSKHFAIGILRLGDAVGVAHKYVTAFERQPALSVLGKRKSAYYCPVHVQP